MSQMLITELPSDLLDEDVIPSVSGAVFTDYRTICAPHVPAIREVLEGKRYRYKVEFNNATFQFYHGCLMAYVVQDGVIRALPPFGLTKDGTPYLQALPEHQLKWLDEFLSLPKSTLLYYFSLLKEVFKGYGIRYRSEDPVSGRTAFVEMPKSLRALLNEVEWRVL